MPIRILPDEIASQIAAGEVVERPASVVKELLENALDAGAKHIAITIEGAGKQLVEVADNGAGIPADELPLAVTRHATSKLSSAADLFRIRTLGFRGEALASIGSISRLTITSRARDSEVGARLRVEGGIAGSLQAVGAPVGTVVRVENLFFNVPARLKFLKTDRTERRQIEALVTRYALAFPQVRFQLNMGKRQTLKTSGQGDRREVLGSLFGVEIARQMIEVLASDDDLVVNGFISPTSVTRSHRRDILFFVNGRPIQNAALTTALIQAYRTLLMVGRYPMAAIFLDMPPDEVDVNVHPTKAEVRFRDPNQVFRGVGRAARRALLASMPIPEFQGAGKGDSWAPRWEATSPSLWETNRPRWEDPDQGPQEQVATDGQGQQELPSVSVPLLRLVGQVAASYLVAEGPDGLYLIDQHAAHERILFERFTAQRNDSVPSQSLLEPQTVELPPSSAEALVGQLSILRGLGFQVEEFGRSTFLVRAVPSLLSGMDPAAALQVIVDDFEEDETPLGEEVEARIIARVCKRAAVKAGQVLSAEEQRALLRDLEQCQAPRTCPHGRPTMIHLSVDLLERQFGRKGAR